MVNSGHKMTKIFKIGAILGLPLFVRKILKNTKDCKISIKGKYSKHVFQFLNFNRFFLPKSDPQVRLLCSRRFFRHQDQPNWRISYIDVICAYDIKWRIWHQMTLMTSIYKIDRFCRSWCLKKRLDPSNRTCESDLG